MAKTFDTTRVVPGTIELVRDANGNYTTKVVGLETINSLSLPEISDTAAVTKTDTDTKTATDITGDTIQKQTQMAFKTPDRDDDPFTTEKMLTSAKDISRNLRDFNPDTASEQFARQAILPGTFDAEKFDETEDKVSIKDPTESVFGRSTVSQEQLQRQDLLPETKVETPQEKLKVTSANVQKGLVEPPLKSTLSNLKGSLISGFNKYIAGEKTKINTEKGSEVTQAGTVPPDAIVQGQPSLGINQVPDAIVQGQPALGINRVPDAIRTGQPAIAPGVPDAIVQGQPSASAKTTFRQSVNTALKGVGEAVQMMSPIMGVVRALGTPRNESASTTAFNRGKFNIVTSSGPMQGRIVGDDGTYDPANNLFHGMNRTSAFGNLEKAGQRRIDRINKTLEKQKNRPGGPSQTLIDRRDKFERELTEYRNEKNNHNINSAKKKGVDTSKLNPNEMRNVAETGDPGGNGGGRSKIVCTMMNESYGFGSFRNKIWMKFHGNIAPEYQKGYHKLFLPLVNYAKQKGITNKIIKNILEHIAVHSTIDMRQTLRGKRHTLGRLYRKVILPLCYWAGKK
jgi:hypothetical protein